MAEIKNLAFEQRKFKLRIWIAGSVVTLGLLTLLSRAITLQVLRYEELFARAEANRTAVLPIVPNRGLILDRNGVVLANNYSAFTLEITPYKVENLTQTIDELSQIVLIQPKDKRRFRRLMEEGRRFDSLPIRTRLTDQEVAKFAAQQFRFPGVEIKARLFRYYPYGELGSHLIGYIGRINRAEKEAMQEWDEADIANYMGTEYIGKLGVEQKYERELHGITGYHEIETSAGGVAVRRLQSHDATPGDSVKLSVDIRLQALVEQLFGARRGALVAVEPETGQVLALVSKPTFDPNLFVEGIDAENWKALNQSIDKPLLNRALRGVYPPGSTFKPLMALAALNSGKRNPQSITYDGGSFNFGGHVFRSHGDSALGSVDMHTSIVKSSNVYYYSLANEMGVDLIYDELSPLGLGKLTGIDLAGERAGVLPSTDWKRRTYKRPEQQKWYAGETISLGIGQGYNSFTMLQLAQAYATLVSGGDRPQPRVGHEIHSVLSGNITPIKTAFQPSLALKPEYVKVVMNAMYGVTQQGTSTHVFAGAPYTSGGKTGTAQAVTIRQNEKYNAQKLAEHQRDHSLYVAFAPLEKPRIVVAVIVENAGFGAAAAAPIARRVFDYWLMGHWPSVEDISATQRGQSNAPMGTPRLASSISLHELSTTSLNSTVTPTSPDALIQP
jgi:penicillin-binding protein 2